MAFKFNVFTGKFDYYEAGTTTLSSTSRSITQATHGFSVGNVLRHNGTIYVTAQANSVVNAESIGIVSEVTDTDTFVLTTEGYVSGLSGLTAGTVYFLSDTSAGAITATQPTDSTDVVKPQLIADSTTSGYFINMRGNVVGETASAITFGKALSLETPTATEDLSIFFTTEAITITKMVAVLLGSSTPSVTWTIRHHTDRSNTGNEVVTSGTTTTSTTTGSVVTSFNDATVPANSFIWFETTAKSGTVTAMMVNIEYTID